MIVMAGYNMLQLHLYLGSILGAPGESSKQATFPVLACDVAAGDSHVAAVCWTGAVSLGGGCSRQR